MNFKNVEDVLKLMKDNEGYSRDQMRAAKEAIDFTSKRDGQWEVDVINRFKGRPRYTDDRTNPIVNQIVGEVMQAEFAGRVRPAGGDASKDTAAVIDGLIRTIRNKSRFDRTINRAGKRVAIAGIAGWEIVKDYADPHSFDLDLMIQAIDDFHERVIIDPNAMSPDGSDAKWAIIKHYVGKDAFKDKFDQEKIPASLSSQTWSDSYYNKPENITIGQLYYLKPITTKLHKMSDGAVYKEDDEFLMVQDELAAEGITIAQSRDVEDFECYQRWFSTDGWLNDEEGLDWNFIPVIPCYGNFEVTEGKVIFQGAVERLMDIQRVHNYAFSRNVEEVALSPRSKWWMTTEQAAGYTDSLKSLNTNMAPVQFYNHVPDQPPPYWSDTTGANQSVNNLIMQTDEGINKAAGIFAANIGDNPHMQSGVAIGKQIDRGNNGTSWVFEALEVSIERTLELLIRAIPNVYDGTREVVLTQDDGSLENMVINKPVLDQQSGEQTFLFDLTQGQYDVAIDIGAGYKNRQEEAVESFERVAATYPALLELAADIHLKNIEAPNFDKVAERARAMMLQNGVIPEEQMTEEELQRLQAAQEAAANQPPPVDLQQMAMEIEQMKAQTAMMDQQNRGQQNQLKMQEMQAKFIAEQQKLQSSLAVDSAKIEQEQQKIDIQAMKLELDKLVSLGKLDAESAKNVNNFALQLAELEVKYDKDLNAEVKSNALVYDPEAGDFVQ